MFSQNSHCDSTNPLLPVCGVYVAISGVGGVQVGGVQVGGVQVRGVQIEITTVNGRPADYYLRLGSHWELDVDPW